jgi:hypothetical protein
LMKEALSSSETSVLTKATRRNIPEDTFFIRDSSSYYVTWFRNPKSYIDLLSTYSW